MPGGELSHHSSGYRKQSKVGSTSSAGCGVRPARGPARPAHFGQGGDIPDLYREYGIDIDAILDACAQALLGSCSSVSSGSGRASGESELASDTRKDRGVDELARGSFFESRSDKEKQKPKKCCGKHYQECTQGNEARILRA